MYEVIVRCGVHCYVHQNGVRDVPEDFGRGKHEKKDENGERSSFFADGDSKNGGWGETNTIRNKQQL